MASKNLGATILSTVDLALGALSFATDADTARTIGRVRKYAGTAFDLVSRVIAVAGSNDRLAKRALDAAIAAADGVLLGARVKVDVEVARKPRRAR
jgi:hypothetical protein